ncbi:hypothetical protein ACFL48_01405 [Pseudomonadota bacterium]
MENTKFPFLSFICGMMKVIGILLLGVGIYFGFYQGLFEPFLPKHSFGGVDAIELAGGSFALFLGVVSMLISEAVKVMLAIELNTRQETETVTEG